MKYDWMLIRGIMSSSFHWNDFLDVFKQKFPVQGVFTPDIIGNGTQNQHHTPWTAQKNIEGMRRQVDSPHRKIILGFSLGGMLAIDWAQRHPEEVAGIVLINVSSDTSPFFKRMTPWSLWKTLVVGLKKNSPDREEQIIKMTTTGLSSEKRPEVAQEFFEIEKQYPVKPMNFIRQVFLATRIKLQENPPNIPILILNSKNDKVVHPDCSLEISEYWNLPLVVHPTAGHDLTLEEPQWVADQVSLWYAQNFTRTNESKSPKIAPAEWLNNKSKAPL